MRAELAGFAGELVVGDDRGNSGDQADGGCEQCFRDTRRDDREAGIVRAGNGLEGGHDADDGTEKADEGAGRADGRKRRQARFERLGLAGHGHIHGAVDTHLQADRRAGAAFEALLPFAHGGDEYGGKAGIVAFGERAIELFERLAGPEDLFELVELAARTGVAQIFVDDDGPGPDGGGQETDHDELDDQACLHEQAPEAHVMRRCSHSNLFHRLQFPEIQTPGGLDRAAT